MTMQKTATTTTSKGSKLERLFEKRWGEYAKQSEIPQSQVHFDFEYNGRFDFAWIDSMVALEIQGGTFVRGAHVRGLGYSDDCKKINLATLKGWRVFQATTDMLRPDKETERILVIEQLALAIKRKVNTEESWISWIRYLDIGETIERHGFFVERQSQTRYLVNETLIREKKTRDAWQSVLDCIMYYPITQAEFQYNKHRKLEK